MANLELYFYGRKKEKKRNEEKYFKAACSRAIISDYSCLNQGHKCLVRSDLESLASSEFEFLSDTNCFIWEF